MKVVTMLGTRPEIIRLSLIIKKLDILCNQVVIHTGQNYDHNLSDIFFEELGVRKPDYYLGATGSFGEQVSVIMKEIEKILQKEKPDRFLVLGDTNSSLASFIAKRMGIPVYHMEAGNRCHNEKVPEEVNRKIIDHSSHILLPYTERSRANLVREGIPEQNIYVTGNPIKEVLDNFEMKIRKSQIMEKFKVLPQGYFLSTLHREENVDNQERLISFIKAFNQLVEKYKKPLIWSVHPRTKKNLSKIKNIRIDNRIFISEPLGFFDFLCLEKQAFCVLSDSGTIQEECCIFRTPNVTLRDETERPETIEVGGNILSGAEEEMIMNCVNTTLNTSSDWKIPEEYSVSDVSNKIAKIVLGYSKINGV